MSNKYLSRLYLCLMVLLSSALSQAEDSNREESLAVLKALPLRTYSGYDLKHRPCQVTVESKDWGVLVNISPLDIPFYLIIDRHEATAKMSKNPDGLQVMTQYRANDPDESPDQFMITSNLTITQKFGQPVQVRVQTYDSGINVTQNAVCQLIKK